MFNHAAATQCFLLVLAICFGKGIQKPTLAQEGVSIAASSDAQRQSYLAHIAAANSALRLHEAAEAKRWLQLAPGRHDRWEWRFLKARSDSSMARIETGDWQAIRAEFSPDGKQLVVACSDGHVRLFANGSWKQASDWKVSEQAVYAARFHPNGNTIATCARDGKIGLWNVPDGNLLWQASHGGEGLADISFCPDGKVLAFSSWYRGPESVRGLVSLWDVTTGKETWRTDFGVKPIVAVRFSPDGGKFAVGTWDALVGIWKLHKPAEAPMQLDFQGIANYSAIDDIAFSPDSRLIAAASKSAAPRIWDLETGQLMQELRGHTSAVFAVAFAGDRSRLITAGSDGVIQLWDADTGNSVHKFLGHDGRIGSIALSPDGHTLASCSADGTIRIWNLNGLGAFPVEARSQYVYGLTISRDGMLMAMGGQEDTDVYVWNLSDNTLRHRLKGLEGSVNYLEFGPDHLVVGGNWGGDVVVWDAGEGREICRLKEADTGGMTQCSFSGNGSWIAVAQSNNQVVVWDYTQRKIAARLPVESGTWSVQFNPASSLLALSSNDGQVRLHRTTDWSEVWSVQGEASEIRALAFSPDGRQLAAVCENGKLFTIDVESGTLERTVRAHSERIWTACFSRDGRDLVTGSADRQVKFWDASRGDLVLTVSDADEVVYNVVASPTSDAVIVNASGQEIFILDPGVP